MWFLSKHNCSITNFVFEKIKEIDSKPDVTEIQNLTSC